MRRFKKLGVFLHDSPADSTALAYAGVFAKLAGSEAVHCIHVRAADDEEEVGTDAAQLEAGIRAKLPPTIAQIATIRVHPGTGVPEILRTARNEGLDLIIVGRRLPSEQLGIGSAFARLARKSPCSVLVVPAQEHPHLERFFVPVDFSAHSKLALELAVALARAASAARPQIVIHSNFTVGYGYRKLGLSLSAAVAEREQATQRELQAFIAGVDLGGLGTEAVCTSAQASEAAILEAALARKMDLIVVGSRGMGSVFLLGSTAERILLHSPLPVLIAKQKGETLRILDVLLGTAE